MASLINTSIDYGFIAQPSGSIMIYPFGASAEGIKAETYKEEMVKLINSVRNFTEGAGERSFSVVDIYGNEFRFVFTGTTSTRQNGTIYNCDYQVRLNGSKSFESSSIWVGISDGQFENHYFRQQDMLKILSIARNALARISEVK